MAFSGHTIASYFCLVKRYVASRCSSKTALARELKSKPTEGVLPCTASKFTEPLPCGLAGITATNIKIKANLIRLLRESRVNRAAMTRVKADKASTPPYETIGKAGDSTWLKAIRVQPKPPNGKFALTSSVNKSVKIVHQRLFNFLAV